MPHSFVVIPGVEERLASPRQRAEKNRVEKEPVFRPVIAAPKVRVTGSPGGSSTRRRRKKSSGNPCIPAFRDPRLYPLIRGRLIGGAAPSRTLFENRRFVGKTLDGRMVTRSPDETSFWSFLPVTWRCGCCAMGDQEEYIWQSQQVDQVHENIFISSVDGAAKKKLLKRLGITHILNMSGYDVYKLANVPFEQAYHGDEFVYKHVSVGDIQSANIEEFFPDTSTFIRMGSTGSNKILVHCYMGVSRSTTVVLAYMMDTLGFSFASSLESVRRKRAICNPNVGFMQQLSDYEQYCAKKRMGESRDNSRHRDYIQDGEEEYVPLYQSLTTQEAADKVIALSRKNSQASDPSDAVDISEHSHGMQISNTGSPRHTPRGGESASGVPTVVAIVPKYPPNSVGAVASNPPQHAGSPAQYGHAQSPRHAGIGLATPRHQIGMSEFEDYNSSDPALQKVSTPRVEMLTTSKTPMASPRVPQYPPMSLHKTSPAPLPPGTMSPLVKDPAGSAVLVYPSPASIAVQPNSLAFVSEPDRAVSPYNFPLSPRDIVVGQEPLSPRQGVSGDFKYSTTHSIPPGGVYSSRLPPRHPGAWEGAGGGGVYGDGAAINASKGVVVSAHVPTKILAPKELSQTEDHGQQQQQQQQQHLAARPGSALPKLPPHPLQPQTSATSSAMHSPGLSPGIYATHGGTREQQQVIAPYTAQDATVGLVSNQQAQQGVLKYPVASSRKQQQQQQQQQEQLQQQQQQQQQQQELKYGLLPRVPSNGAREHAIDSKHPAQTQVENQHNATQMTSVLASRNSAHPDLVKSLPLSLPGPSSARPTVVNSVGDGGSSSGAKPGGGGGAAAGDVSTPTTYSRQPVDFSPSNLPASSRFSGLNTWGNSPKKPWLAGQEGALPSAMQLNGGRDTRSSYGGGPGGGETRSSYGGGGGGRETRSSFGGEAFASPRSNIDSRYSAFRGGGGLADEDSFSPGWY